MPTSDPPSNFDAIVERYRTAFDEHGMSTQSLLYRPGREELRYGALTADIAPDRRSTVLDFGCGLAHLRDHLAEHVGDVVYTGVDVVPEFIDAASSRLPDDTFQLITSVDDLDGRWDHVVASGTFNLRYEQDDDANFAYLTSMLTGLFERTDVTLSCDFLTSHVDFRHDGAHHQPIGQLTDFVATHLSRRFRIDHTYLPYEYALTVYADDERVPDDAALYQHPVRQR